MKFGFENLPVELKIRIFSHSLQDVFSLSLTCRSFNYALNHNKSESLWEALFTRFGWHLKANTQNYSKEIFVDTLAEKGILGQFLPFYEPRRYYEWRSKNKSFEQRFTQYVCDNHASPGERITDERFYIFEQIMRAKLPSVFFRQYFLSRLFHYCQGGTNKPSENWLGRYEKSTLESHALYEDVCLMIWSAAERWQKKTKLENGLHSDKVFLALTHFKKTHLNDIVFHGDRDLWQQFKVWTQQYPQLSCLIFSKLTLDNFICRHFSQQEGHEAFLREVWLFAQQYQGIPQSIVAGYTDGNLWHKKRSSYSRNYNIELTLNHYAVRKYSILYSSTPVQTYQSAWEFAKNFDGMQKLMLTQDNFGIFRAAIEKNSVVMAKQLCKLAKGFQGLQTLMFSSEVGALLHPVVGCKSWGIVKVFLEYVKNEHDVVNIILSYNNYQLFTWGLAEKNKNILVYLFKMANEIELFAQKAFDHLSQSYAHDEKAVGKLQQSIPASVRITPKVYPSSPERFFSEKVALGDKRGREESGSQFDEPSGSKVPRSTKMS